jgi:hypothetical protein
LSRNIFNFSLASAFFSSNTFISSAQEIILHTGVLNKKIVFFNIRQKFWLDFFINDSMYFIHIRVFGYLILHD